MAAAEPSFVSGDTLAGLEGDWALDLNGKQVTTPLKSWEDAGRAILCRTGYYRKQFTADAAPAGKRGSLEIADVHDYARVKLNGKELEAHGWQPYRWDITSALKAGSNDLQVEVFATRGREEAGAERLRQAAAGAPAAPAAPAGGGGRGRGGAPAVSGLLGPVRLIAR